MLECTRLAVRLVLAGFKMVEELEGLPESSIDRLTNVPKEQAILSQAVRTVGELGFSQRTQRTRRDLGLMELDRQGPLSADEVATGLSPEELERLESSNKILEAQLGIQIGWEKHDPEVQSRMGSRATRPAPREKRQR